MLCPSKPAINCEWLVTPVVAKVFIIESYDVPAIAEYLHVAASLVSKLIVACVVPDGKVPEGCPLDLTGGVVSGTFTTQVISRLLADVCPFPASSLHDTYLAYCPLKVGLTMHVACVNAVEHKTPDESV